ncbi:hypothetical protein R1sor_021198 [Riccia sorocarpa]|uniref:Uncharacterized protein n=1 Tax=Riccia sorocarpa TaxID=122646 RepID=A0ABD3GGC8_9MARC
MASGSIHTIVAKQVAAALEEDGHKSNKTMDLEDLTTRIFYRRMSYEDDGIKWTVRALQPGSGDDYTSFLGLTGNPLLHTQLTWPPHHEIQHGQQIAVTVSQKMAGVVLSLFESEANLEEPRQIELHVVEKKRARVFAGRAEPSGCNLV